MDFTWQGEDEYSPGDASFTWLVIDANAYEPPSPPDFDWSATALYTPGDASFDWTPQDQSAPYTPPGSPAFSWDQAAAYTPGDASFTWEQSAPEPEPVEASLAASFAPPAATILAETPISGLLSGSLDPPAGLMSGGVGFAPLQSGAILALPSIDPDADQFWRVRIAVPASSGDLSLAIRGEPDSIGLDIYASTDPQDIFGGEFVQWDVEAGEAVFSDPDSGGVEWFFELYSTNTSQPTDPTTAEVFYSQDVEAAIATALAGPAFNARGLFDFTGLIDPLTTQLFYRCEVTADGLPPVDVRISSWQATVQEGRAIFLQAVVPAAQEAIDAILERAAADGSFAVYKGARELDGTVREALMATAPMDAPRIDRGPTRFTATLTGAAQLSFPTAPDPTVTRALAGARTISTDGGGTRVRADVDFLLRPGMFASADGETFRVSYINYFVNIGQQFMDVGERENGGG